jgi:hypothetical protein
VYEDKIVILDLERGLFVFTYLNKGGSSVTDLVNIPLSVFELNEAYGFEVTRDGGYNLLLISGGSDLRSFRFESFYDQSSFKEIDRHYLPFTLISRADIDATGSVITIRVGDLVLIYDRYDEDFKHTRDMIYDVQYL